ncbi:MAG: putative BsuMI modification methylase subunit YdiO [Fimbriimonadales bacterium]|nr:MAG: putative BsuMI modification methylase subunit YdiO [Fimbriimonadales bacterium]
MQVTLPGVDVPAVVYESGDDLVTRCVSVNGRSSVQSLPAPTVESAGDDAFSRWWWSWLRDRRSPHWRQGGKSLSIVELFCGAGGLGLGACEAARAVGMRPSILLAVDHDQAALDVYAANLPVLSPLRANAAGLTSYVLAGSNVSPRFAEPPVLLESRLAYAERKVDLFLAGPPCEGHSNFNNHTRRDDPRNGLYLDAVATAVGIEARAIVIENVPEAKNDRSHVVQRALGLLREAGYSAVTKVVGGVHVGVPQERKRLFLVAARDFPVDDLEIPLMRRNSPVHTVRWAIEDLMDAEGTTPFDTPSVLSQENERRARFLLEHDLWDLPNEHRPACHRNGHTYPSVYGRMRWDEPCQTITSGFTSPGRGRYVHPSRPRALTPHEAARLQTFPDWYDWSPPGFKPTKKAWTGLIGDAVPPMLAFAVVLPVVRMLAGRETTVGIAVRT